MPEPYPQQPDQPDPLRQMAAGVQATFPEGTAQAGPPAPTTWRPEYSAGGITAGGAAGSIEGLATDRALRAMMAQAQQLDTADPDPIRSLNRWTAVHEQAQRLAGGLVAQRQEAAQLQKLRDVETAPTEREKWEAEAARPAEMAALFQGGEGKLPEGLHLQMTPGKPMTVGYTTPPPRSPETQEFEAWKRLYGSDEIRARNTMKERDSALQEQVRTRSLVALAGARAGGQALLKTPGLNDALRGLSELITSADATTMAGTDYGDRVRATASQVARVRGMSKKALEDQWASLWTRGFHDRLLQQLRDAQTDLQARLEENLRLVPEGIRPAGTTTPTPGDRYEYRTDPATGKQQRRLKRVP